MIEENAFAIAVFITSSIHFIAAIKQCMFVKATCSNPDNQSPVNALLSGAEKSTNAYIAINYCSK